MDYGATTTTADVESGSFKEFFSQRPASERTKLLAGGQEQQSPKEIGAVGSFAIFINAIVGPGLLSLPKVFDESGAIVPSALLILGFVLAASSTVARCETVALMPDNQNFERVVEFCDPALKFVGIRTFYVTHVMFYLAAMSVAIASIALVSETADIVVAKIFGRTYAVAFGETTRFVVWGLSNCQQQQKCKPFITGNQISGSSFFISLGYAVTFALIFPISSTTHISEGMPLQFASFLITSVAIPLIACKDTYRAVTAGSHLSLFLSGPRAMSASGIVLFNLMYGIFVSTWLCEKRPEVSVVKTVYRSSTAGCLVMIAYGASVAASTREVAADGLLDATEQGEPFAIVSMALLFGFFVIASGIPISCIMARHNLVSSTITLVDSSTATALCVFLPWAVGWLFYTAPPYRMLVNYSGLFVVSWLALWLPFFVLLHAIEPPRLFFEDDDLLRRRKRRPVLTFSDDDAAASSMQNSDEQQQALSSLATAVAYLRWFAGLLVAPPDDDVDTVLAPLPASLRPYARNIYAVLLLVVTSWIFGSLASYLFAFVNMTQSTLKASATSS
mmetsp:Transcript_535/g.1490  ORF Transcript_535/g.1490 Transcript_535/m.1490 type:complete len:562 (-) Transcript_535:212-1897(-)